MAQVPIQERFLPDTARAIEKHVTTNTSNSWLQASLILTAPPPYTTELFRQIYSVGGKELLATTTDAETKTHFMLYLMRDVNTNEVSINDLAVPVQRQGLGTEIVDIIKAQAQAHQIHKIIAHSIVSPQALNFWIKQGFVPDASGSIAELLVP